MIDFVRWYRGLAAYCDEWLRGWSVEEEPRAFRAASSAPPGGAALSPGWSGLLQGPTDTPATALYYVIDGPRGRVLDESGQTIARFADAEAARTRAAALAVAAAPALFQVRSVEEKPVIGFGALMTPHGKRPLSLDPARMADLMAPPPEPEPPPLQTGPPGDLVAVGPSAA